MKLIEKDYNLEIPYLASLAYLFFCFANVIFEQTRLSSDLRPKCIASFNGVEPERDQASRARCLVSLHESLRARLGNKRLLYCTS